MGAPDSSAPRAVALDTHALNAIAPRKRLIAHALVTDAAGRVLLCETRYKEDWELPGGIVEPGESPLQGCRREMVEEMGWAPRVGGVLVVDWLRPWRGWEDAVELVFDTEPVSPADAEALRPDGREIAALHWLSPEQAAARMTSFGADRLASALQARAQSTSFYAEAGRRVDQP